MYVVLGAATAGLGILLAHAVLPVLVDVPGALEDASTVAFAVAAVGIAVRLATGFVPRVLVGRADLVGLRAVGLTRSVVALGATVVLVDHRATAVVAVASAFLVGELAAAVAGLGRVGRLPGAGWWDGGSARAHVRASGPMLASGAFAVVSSRIDPVIVAVGAGAAATGTYGVVLRIYEVGRSSVELLSLFLMPGTARRLAAGDAAGVRVLYSRAIRFAAVVVWPAAALVAVLAPAVLGVWLTRDLVDGPATLAAAMLLVVAVTPGAAAFYVLTGADLVARVLPWQAAGAVVSATVGIALVNVIGAPAVFIGSAVAAVVTTPGMVGVVADAVAQRIGALLEPVVRPAVVSAVLAVALLAVRALTAGDVPQLAVGAACMLAAVAAGGLWAVPKEDRARLRGLLPIGRSLSS
jgi:O-antigen/teichoic acid export membrane protein